MEKGIAVSYFLSMMHVEESLLSDWPAEEQAFQECVMLQLKVHFWPEAALETSFWEKDDSAASVLLDTGLLEPSKFPTLPENPPKAADFHSSVLL